uniref:Sorting nexin n=1 Tax=Strigops habroptila TaxID=2489341 RepID=A0A672TJ38_STRHB
MALRVRALYDFRSENPGEISLWEHKVLSLCSEQDIEGWLEGVNSRGDRGLFPASYVQVIRSPVTELPPTSRYANLSSGSFEPLPPHSTFKPAALELFSLPAAAGYPFSLVPYGSSYQPSQGSDDDWDDDWDESSTVADEPGALGSSYHDYEVTGSQASGHYCLSTQSKLSLRPRSGHLAGHPHPPSSGAKSSATVSHNLNRFFIFVKSGGEAFVLGEASGFVKDRDKLCVVLGLQGPEWQKNPYPFQCSIEDPTKQTKFKGMKSYIAYKLVPSHTRQQVHCRYKHFDWLYGRLAEKFPVISVPHLPEKQATGRFEEDFISKRRKGLAWWMDHMCSHPVLAQCHAFQHFLTCPSTDEKAWKQGKRKAEKDEMVGANFFLTISVTTGPEASLDLQEVESQVDGFKAFTKKMDKSTLHLNHTANEFAHKQVTGFKKEYQKVGHSFKCLSQAFQLDQQAFSTGLNQAIAFTAEAYDAIGDLFADQPWQDLNAVMDLLALYQGHLANFPDIIHIQKGNTFTKLHVEEGKMELQKAEGIQECCNIISFVTLAEINHFHKIRVRDFKSQMQHFLQQQILFFQKVTQKLEEALHKYDSV